MSAWTAGQVKLFAKQIAASPEGKAWWAFPQRIRDAIISHNVLMVVFSQRGSISIDDVRELRIQIEWHLGKHHAMKVYT